MFSLTSFPRNFYSFRYIIFIDLHIFGTSPMNLFQRGFWLKSQVKVSKDGPVLIHLGAPERYTLMRFHIISILSIWKPCSNLCFLYQSLLLFDHQVISDFAFLPFGGGPRKCVGDQFALMESTVALAMLLQKFDVELRGSPESVELVTGATIHTKSGLWCKLKKRSNGH